MAMTADGQGQDPRETAAVFGMHLSAFIVHRPGAAAALARVEGPLACREEIERLRLIEDPETWKAINEQVETRLALERGLR
ncbi:MAG: hypothetical protein OXI95_09440 [bacterium]|nr:hypothetical protein [bacterium]